MNRTTRMPKMNGELPKSLKVCEVFESIQGEGKYVGLPCLFFRLSGCTRACSFCDSKYHTEGKDWKLVDIANLQVKSNMIAVVWTGGEPLLQFNKFAELWEITGQRCKKADVSMYPWHVESNGDLIETKISIERLASLFEYICVSPKTKEVAKRLGKYHLNYNFDVKVVTDLETVGVDMIGWASMLMPLTTDDEERNKEIQKKVWKYCVGHGINYSPRLHIDVFGRKVRGV